jgi:hypothetical protein
MKRFQKWIQEIKGGFVVRLKSDLSGTSKCDQNHISHICKLITPKAELSMSICSTNRVSGTWALLAA